MKANKNQRLAMPDAVRRGYCYIVNYVTGFEWFFKYSTGSSSLSRWF